MITSARTFRLMLWREAPKGAKRIAPSLAAGWVRGWVLSSEHRSEVLEAYRWLAPAATHPRGWMDEREIHRYVLPRIERALLTGELLLVERVPIAGWKPPIQEEKKDDGGKGPEKAAPTKTWIEFLVQDNDGNPLEGIRYEARLTDDSKKTGTTGATGLVRFDGIDAGICEFTLVDFGADQVEEYDPTQPKREPLLVELVDGDGKPIAGQKFVVKLSDGSKKEGKTGADGTGSVENLDAGEYEVTFPDLAESA